MSRSLLLLLVLLAWPVYAEGQGTAYDALKIVGTRLSRAYISRVVSVNGTDGDPQPRTWRIVVQDRTLPAGVREIVVQNGQIIADGAPSGAAGGTIRAPIKTAQLNLDSSGAFEVANHTADASHTNFARVNYTLRSNERGSPVWIVSLLDGQRRAVGTIHIAANRGGITRVEGMYAGANMANVEQDPVRRGGRRNDSVEREPPDPVENSAEDDDDGDVNPVKKEIKRMFRRTKSDAERMFARVRRPFEDFFYRR
ncbi:MAG: hypothetical protein ACR2ID_06370 [Chthoniobacterales bacterium]